MADLQQQNPLDIREAYLAEVSFELRNRLSPLEAYETIEEMRAHLTMLAAAYEEVGCDAAEAMVQATLKFGKPKVVAASHGENSHGQNLKRMSREEAPALIGAALGSLTLLSVDLFLCLLRSQWNLLLTPDIVIGGVAGLMLGLLARYQRPNPYYFGLFSVLVVDALGLMLYSSYAATGRFFELGVMYFVFTLGSFITGWTSAYVAKRPRNRSTGLRRAK
jgi:hypothetical protein